MWRGKTRLGVGVGIGQKGSLLNQNEPETEAYILGLTTPLSDAQISRLNNFFKVVKTGLGVSALSDAMDWAYILSGQTEESSLRNIVKRQFDLTKSPTAPTWTQYKGFKGGTNKYLKTGYNPVENGSAYTLDSASMGYYCNDNVDVTGARSMGARVAFGNNMSYLGHAGGTLTSFINQDETTIALTTQAATNGMFIASRNTSTNLYIYRNKIKLNDFTVSSDAIPNLEYYLLAYNNNGIAGGFDTKEYGFYFCGKKLTAAQIAVITDAYDEYLTSIYYEGNEFNNGKLVLAFDDNPVSWSTLLLPLLQSKGVKVTGYVVGNWVGTPGFMTWPQVVEMYADGQDMQCHTFNHAVLDNLDEAQVISELNQNTAAFTSHGLPAPIHLTYPTGLTKLEVKGWVSSLRLTGRLGESGNDYIFNGIFGKNVDKYYMPSKTFGNETIANIDTYRKLIDIAKRNKLALCTYGHYLVDNDAGVINANYATIELLEAVIDYAISKGVDIVTMSQLYPQLV